MIDLLAARLLGAHEWHGPHDRARLGVHPGPGRDELVFVLVAKLGQAEVQKLHLAPAGQHDVG
jgi:hypothetical protein